MKRWMMVMMWLVGLLLGGATAQAASISSGVVSFDNGEPDSTAVTVNHASFRGLDLVPGGKNGWFTSSSLARSGNAIYADCGGPPTLFPCTSSGDGTGIPGIIKVQTPGDTFRVNSIWAMEDSLASTVPGVDAHKLSFSGYLGGALQWTQTITFTAPDGQYHQYTGFSSTAIDELRILGLGHNAWYLDDLDITGFLAPPPPTVTTNAASAIGATGATLNGTVNANGSSTTVSFEYGLTTAYGSSIAATPGTVSGSSNTSVSASISGLTCGGATYHFRAKGVSAGGTTNGSDQTFTTAACPPSLSINDVSLNEGNAGTTSFSFTVSLSAPAGPGGVTFDIATADGTATAPGDYTAKSLTGQTIPTGSSTYTFDVLANGDSTPEANETFFVNVSNVTGATVVDGQGTGSIVNDDFLPTVTGITPNSGPVAGGTSVTITGTNFTGATAVTIGGAAATGITVVNATTITATTPAGTAGARDVAVTTPGGTGTGTGLFTYIAAPVVTTSAGATASIPPAAVAIDPALTVTDSDSATLASATVSITANFQAGQDVLGFTNAPATMGNISGNYVPATGILTLTSAGATATVAQWQAALRSVSYANSAASPNASTRTVSFAANDGTSNSSVATKDVSITLIATPTAFSFVDQSGVALSALITSAPVQINGINTVATWIASSGTACVSSANNCACDIAAWATGGTVSNGQYLCARHTSGAGFSTAVNTVVTVGAGSDTFTSTTLAADTTPDAFSFTPQTGAALNSVATSNTITVSGIDSAANISIVGGTYSIGGGAYVSTPGTVTNGQTVSVRLTASASVNTLTSATLTIGGVSGVFNVTTTGTAIPTLSEWAMLLLAGLLGLVGFKRGAFRGRQ